MPPFTPGAACLAAVGVLFAMAAQAQEPEKRDIVVTGKRYGEADVLSESELDEEAIATYAAGSIRELLDQLAPEIDGADAPPALIVNGRRIADPHDVRGFPPEALQRVEILPREAAARYGLDPDRRVVNLVLKPRFRMLSGEASATLPTQGDRDGERLGLQQIAVAGASRWNSDLALSRDSRLLAGARDVAPPPGGDNRERSLLPATRQAEANLGMAQPLGSDGTMSLGLRANIQDSRRLLGRAAATGEVLTSDQRTRGFGLSAGTDRRFGTVDADASLTYDWREARNDTAREAGLGSGPGLDRSRSTSSAIAAKASLGGPLALLPGDPLRWRLDAGYAKSSSHTRLVAADAADRDDRVGSGQGDARLSLVLPLANRGAGLLQLPGRLSASASLGASQRSGGRLRLRRTAGLAWSPVEMLNLNLRWSLEDNAPDGDQFSPKFMIYASAGQGFRPGGANNVPGLSTTLITFQSDSLWSYEFGFKSTLLDNKLTFNAAAFQTDWNNIQVAARAVSGPFSFLSNAGAARIRGGEAELTYQPTSSFDFNLGVGYSDGKLTQDQANSDIVLSGSTGLAGDRLIDAPKWTINAGAEYRYEINDQLTAFFRTDGNYRSSMQTSFRPQTDPLFERYGNDLLLNVRTGVRNDRWSITLYIQNLTNRKAYNGVSTTQFIKREVYSVAPRTFGVVANTRF